MISPGFFTGFPPFRLPHPPVPIRIILATHNAIGRAFEIIRTDPVFPLNSAREDDITLYLHTILEDRFLASGEVAGFSRRRVRNVVRAPEVTNYDGSHPAKKPDLVAFLLRREHFTLRSQDAVFAECKPVDDNHPLGTHYCDKGILRFVQGDYAWAMQEGMIIGYVRGDRTIPGDLAPVIASARLCQTLGSPDPPALVGTPEANGRSQPLHATMHQRSFLWPRGQGRASWIRLYHSWHLCT